MPWPSLLLDWYHAHRRTLPWRENPLPYPVWISEIMLQQTQVDTVIPYFHRFLAAFPTIDALAAADQEQVLMLWEGLGYYSRARRLHQAAQHLVAHHHSQLPTTYDELLKLPGFGTYTTAAVASIAHQQPVPVVDGNVLRVYARLTCMVADIANQKTKTAVFQALHEPIQQVPKPGDFNQALMELGALICRPKSPTCLICPLREHCQAHAQGRVDELPVKAKRKPVPHVDVVVALITRGPTILAVQRPDTGMLASLWELPGGPVQAPHSHAQALAAQVHRATGLTVTPGPPICRVTHAYSHFTIAVTAYQATATGTPTHGTWCTAQDLATRPFSKVTRKLLQHPKLNPHLPH